MADANEDDIAAYEAALHPVVLAAYREEQSRVAAKIEAHARAGYQGMAGPIHFVLNNIPHIDSVFDEDTVGPASYASDVNLYSRCAEVIAKIETSLGITLSEQTKADIREDVAAIWNL